MAKMVGRGTFLVKHVIVGMNIGMILAVRRPANDAA